jgi:hypothetical protein
MKKRRLVAALMYATTTICLFAFVDFLYGAGPRTSHLARVAHPCVLCKGGTLECEHYRI